MPIKKIVFYIMCALLAIMLVISGITIAKAGNLIQAILNPQPPVTESTTVATDPTQPTDATKLEETTAPTSGTVDANHKHNYQEYQTSPATCTEGGYTLYKCTCGDVETQDLTKALGHIYGAGMVVSSCTEENYTQYECSVCGNVDKRNITPASGHNFNQTEHFPATCTEDAYIIRTCSNPNCNETETENLDGTSLGGHAYILKEEVAATCSTNGYKLFTCANTGCTAQPIKEEIPTTGHVFKWNNGEATCSKSGCTEKLTFDQLMFTNTEHIGNTYVIIVGTGTGANDLHKLYSYTIIDNRTGDEQSAHPLNYELDKTEGLVITYTDANGDEQTFKLGFIDNSITIEDDPTGGLTNHPNGAGWG